jgi:hypothetical protein
MSKDHIENEATKIQFAKAIGFGTNDWAPLPLTIS